MQLWWWVLSPSCTNMSSSSWYVFFTPGDATFDKCSKNVFVLGKNHHFQEGSKFQYFAILPPSDRTTKMHLVLSLLHMHGQTSVIFMENALFFNIRHQPIITLDRSDKAKIWVPLFSVTWSVFTDPKVHISPKPLKKQNSKQHDTVSHIVRWGVRGPPKRLNPPV